MRRQLVTAVIAIAVFTAITLLYSVGTTLADQVLFDDKSDGSFVRDAQGQVVGSKLIGQGFSKPRYVHPRPAADDYASGPDYSYGSNYGTSNETLLKDVEKRVRAFRKENRLGPNVPVPVDAVTSSGSGLDPHITLANAKLQAPRIARVRRLPLTTVLAMIEKHTDERALEILGEPAVNVLELNLELDRPKRTG